MRLDTAEAVWFGDVQLEAVYLGDELIWPSSAAFFLLLLPARSS